MKAGLIRYSLKALLSFLKVVLKVTLTILTLYFLSIVVRKEEIIEVTTSSSVLFKTQQPAFYFSLSPSWYDARLSLIAPSQLKKTGIALMRNGMSYEDWMKWQDYVTRLSNIDGQGSNESLRYIDDLNVVKQRVSELISPTNDGVKQLGAQMLQLVSKVRPLKFSDWFPEIHYWGKKNEFHQTMFNTFDGERLSVFRPALKLSAILSLFAFLFSVIGGTLIALIYMNCSGLWQKIINFKLQLFYVFPVFCLAILAVQFLTSSYYSPLLNLFPGPGAFLMLSSDSSFLSLLVNQSAYMILPAIIIAIPLSAGIALRWIGGMNSEMTNPYITTLRSKGLSERKIYKRHILRNVAIPMVIYFAMLLPALLSGLVLIENIFAIGGIGRLTLQCVMNRDLSSLLLIVGFIVIVSIVFNKIGIFFTRIVDPRLKERV